MRHPSWNRLARAKLYRFDTLELDPEPPVELVLVVVLVPVELTA